MLFIKIGCYLLSIGKDTGMLDLVSYAGYKFVPVVACQMAGFFFSRSIMWIIFGYVVLALSFFLVSACMCVYFTTKVTAKEPKKVRNPS